MGEAIRSWRLSQPDYGALLEQRKALSVWAMASGKGPVLEELGKLTPPKMEARDDSPDYGAQREARDSSPDYGSLRETVKAKDSLPPLVTPERAGRARSREKETGATGPKLSGRWWDRVRDMSTRFGTATGPEAVMGVLEKAWDDLDTDTASEAGTDGRKAGGEWLRL